MLRNWTGASSTYEEVHRTRQDFLIVQAAVIPTNVFPAPQGNTMMPDRARLDINQKCYIPEMGKCGIPITEHFA
jgi:hypothetical protein